MGVVILRKGYLKKDYLESLNEIDKKLKVLDAHKYCGIIKLQEDPVEYQKKLRNECR